jgi:hypothetical protein
MHAEIQMTTIPGQSAEAANKPNLTIFMQRHRLSEEVASRVLQVASNVDKADALAELMR